MCHAMCICSYVINELIQTEKQYVEDLAQIVLVCILSLITPVRVESYYA